MRWVLAVVAMLVLVAACGGDPGPSVGSATVPSSIWVRSDAFNDGDEIPERFTCDGAGQVPDLRWTGVPDTTRALALAVDDPDAPGGVFTHWVVLDLPTATRSIDGGRLPSAAVQGANSAGDTGWTPPCPPTGDGPHHYRFTLYALDAATDLPDGASLAEASAAIEDQAVARGTLTGTYTRR